MTLERGYRRLLACYPWEYRREYEEELLGVLLDDAGPQQRRPRVRDVLDLLGSALRAHFRCTATRLSEQPWRNAAAILGLLAPLVMFAYTARLPLLYLSQGWVDSPLPFTWASIWLTVAVLAAIGWHRPAAVLAWPAAALEVARADGRYDYLSVFNLWPTALAVLAAVALTVAGPRSGAILLGRWRLALLALATLMLGSAPAIAAIVLPSFSVTDVGNFRTPWIFTNNVTYLEALLLSVGYTIGLLTVLSLNATLRRRILALLVPVGASLLLSRVGLRYSSVMDRPFDAGVPAGLNLTQWLLLALVPLSTLAVAVAAVHRWERSARVLALDNSASRLARPVGPRSSPPDGEE
ncbi:hypothetical protein ACFP2T_26260 [Plantactinospora solaniradicis]|uniref:Uncharacterized protein n=1 Tax=Plantactinospora solaniradicis TaxID=1723736 RepID=A0ABW1KFY1_9ACTN